MNFIKMQSCGNDFMIIDRRKQHIDLSSRNIKALGNYKTSVGFDQLITIENSQNSDIAIRIYNNDGSESLACGNGTRCVAKLIFEETMQNILSIETKERILLAKKIGDQIEVNMGKARLDPIAIQLYNIECHYVEIGNPHVVIVNSQVNYLELGPKIEKDSHFPNGVNVNFANVIDKSTVELKVWERGAGATLACGSGACATFFLLYSEGLINKEVLIKQAGGDLTITIHNDDEILMKGDAHYCYRGII